MDNYSNKEEVQKQYGTAEHLNSRILLHQLFSTSKTGWPKWVFDNYRLQSNQRVLELGCGNGSIWQENAGKIPGDVQLVLSDFSAGMLKTAEKNTKAVPAVAYQVIDAQAIPFPDKTFDVIIANHMLYHLPDISGALKEIARTLKPEGTFYATTFGKDNMQELKDLLTEYDKNFVFPQDELAQAFGLENGAGKLAEVFAEVELRRYPDSLHVTDWQILLDYILSTQTFAEEPAQTSRKLQAFIQEKFSARQSLDISKDAGIFVAGKPA